MTDNVLKFVDGITLFGIAFGALVITFGNGSISQDTDMLAMMITCVFYRIIRSK